MKIRCLLLVAFGLILFCLSAGAGDWPQWRGPNRDGVSQETGLLKEWPKDGPKLLWQVNDLGGGYSTPAVVGDRLYVLSDKGGEEFLHILGVANGKEIQSVKIGKVGPNMGPQYPGSRSTPTVDKDAIYCLGSDGDLVCLEKEAGTVRWKQNLRKDYGGKTGNWAYAESPLIDGDTLVCTPGGPKAALVAMNKKTGDVIWKSEVPGNDVAAYSSVVIAEIGGVKQYVQMMAKGVVGVEAKTGKFLWRYDKTVQGSPANIPTPVAHASYVYSGTGKGGGGLVKVKHDKDAFTAEEVYAMAKLPTAIGGAVLVGEYLYGTNGAGLMCIEFTTGKEKWQDKCVGAASLLYADGCLYLHGENGEVALVEATPDAYREKGRFAPPDQPKHSPASQKAWAYPVVANGKMYIHDLNMLWCYDVKAAK